MLNHKSIKGVCLFICFLLALLAASCGDSKDTHRQDLDRLKKQHSQELEAERNRHKATESALRKQIETVESSKPTTVWDLLEVVAICGLIGYLGYRGYLAWEIHKKAEIEIERARAEADSVGKFRAQFEREERNYSNCGENKKDP